MPEVIDNYEEAQRIRESFIAETNIPLEESTWEDYPVPEEVGDDFPDNYIRQYEIIGYDTPEGYIGVWWLSGDRFQVFYDEDERWGRVGDFDHIEEEIIEKVK